MPPADAHDNNAPQAPRLEVVNAPLAVVDGEPLTQLPDEVYVPADGLRVLLDSFEGPLDLLLYLIRKKNIDILNLPMATITDQYVAYITMMREMRIEVASEYLVMASTLAEIKSRMLLPRVVEDEDEEDPRAELVRRLIEYTRYKHAAEDLNALSRLERDQSLAAAHTDSGDVPKPEVDVKLNDIVIVLQDILQRAEMSKTYHVTREQLSVKERITQILGVLSKVRFAPFSDFFSAEEGRGGVIVTVIAMLELLRVKSVDFEQSQPYAPIYLTRVEA